MKHSTLLQSIAGLCLLATTSPIFSQSTALQLFGPVNVRPSTKGTGSGDNEAVFNTTNLNLVCPSSPTGVISSSTDGNGYVLVDNFISLTVGGGNTSDICSGGTVESGNQQNCFSSDYGSKAQNNGLVGTDPDTLLPAGGVGPIDISSYLSSGPIQATVGIVDTGGYLAGSTLYLVTNCTPGGVTGPAQVTGNPISSSNPTSQQLQQTFSFNSATDQQVELTYDLSEAQGAGSLSITNGTIPKTTDTPIDPTTFQSDYVQGTSFATSNCLVHTGELFGNSAACKLYTLTCQVGTSSTEAGALCPTSSERNEIFEEDFDGPSFTLPDISVANGPTFHQGIGLIEAKDGWGGGTCVFDPASSLAKTLCPQNLLTNFSGPGAYKSGGRGQSPNSTFITVAPVPEDLTTVSVTGQQSGYWVNSRSATLNFVSTPPSVPASLPGAANFVAAPILSLTYGVSSASSVPQPPTPVPTDTVLTNPVACPAPGSSNPAAATVFTPPAQAISVSADGQYLVHYLAQDCAGTEELKFTNSGGTWSTSYYTFPLNVDTVLPVVASGPTLSPAPSTNGGIANSYLIGQKVTASYSCTDDRSGIVTCGAYTFAPGTTLNTGTLTSTVDTSKAGPGTFTVNALDAAGNPATASVNYTVAAPPVNLYLLKLAPARAKPGSTLTYAIAATNLSKQTASVVTVTDPLPAGVTFVKATAQQLICSNGKCVNDASCSFANNTVSCTVSTMTLLTPMAVEIQVTVQAQAGTQIKNTATMTTANPVTTPGKAISTATTTVY